MGVLDTILEKTREIKVEYEQRKRDEKESSLSIKENDLIQREEALKAKEQEIEKLLNALVKKEKQLEIQRRRPLYVFLLMSIVAGLVTSHIRSNYELIPRTKKPNLFEPSSASVTTRTDVPSQSVSHEVQQAYDGMDVKDGKFDLGKYCLNQEKQGVMSFEQCLTLSVAKKIKQDK